MSLMPICLVSTLLYFQPSNHSDLHMVSEVLDTIFICVVVKKEYEKKSVSPVIIVFLPRNKKMELALWHSWLDTASIHLVGG